MTKPRILIIGPAWVGDMVMTQVLVQALNQKFPDSAIDIMGPTWSLGLVSRMPGVAQAIAANFSHGQLALAERRRFAKGLRYQYDKAYIIPNSFKSALIPWWAKIPERIGWTGEMRYGLLTQHRSLNKTSYPMMVQRIAALADLNQPPLPPQAPYLKVSRAQQEKIRADFKICQQTPLFAICPGAAYGPSKQWHAEGFSEIATHYAQQGWQVCLIGSKKEQPLCKQIVAQAKATLIDLSGKTTLLESVDLLSTTKGVLTNDSGLMHIASALNRPLVALYGSSSPAFTPPLGDNAKVLSAQLSCSPCFKRTCPLGHHDCMRLLTPKKVLAALEQACEYSL